MEKDNKANRREGGGNHDHQAALVAGADMRRGRALEHLEKLIKEHQDFLQTKVNVHKEIKSKATSICRAMKNFKTLDEEWRVMQQRPLCATPKKKNKNKKAPNDSDCSQTIAGTVTDKFVEDMDTGGEGDVESVVEDRGETGTRPGKRKERHSPDPTDSRTNKKKDLKPSPLKNMAAQNAKKKETSEWQKVQSRKERVKRGKNQHPELPKEPQPKPRRTKPHKRIRPDALIIRPAETAKYAEILRRIKQDVPDEQVRTTVDKIQKTRTGSMLITLSRKSTDKGQALQKTIAGILQEDAKVICKGPQEDVEIRDLDDTTTKTDVQAALQTVTGDSCEISLEAIKIRKAYRGTQTAVVTLPAAAARGILEGSGKIRIGWVNCRIRATRRPIQCFKCWHFGHYGSQCRSNVDRSKLCIRCGQEGHKIAECKNPAKCALCAEKQGTENVAHHAGTYRCPAFKEALQRMTSKSMKILQLNLNHCEAARRRAVLSAENERTST